MKFRKEKDRIDESTVIADMSAVAGRRRLPSFEENSEKPENLKGKNLAAFIGGALSATLMIGLAYAAGLGLVIFLLYLFFSQIS